jgi:ATP synthase protein I
LDERDGKKERQKPGWYSAAEASAIGIEIVVALGVGYWIGAWLDRRFGTKPWLTVAFFLLGVGAAIKAMVRVARAYRRENPDPPESGEGPAGGDDRVDGS